MASICPFTRPGRRLRELALSVSCAIAPWLGHAAPAAATAPATPASSTAADPATAAGIAALAADDVVDMSASARRIYYVARQRLLQVRTLLRDQDSQASVGSGSLVGPGGLILTNYHVVSQAALEPQRYRLNFQMADGEKGVLALVAFDVVHDLALVRMTQPPSTLAARGTFA